MKCHTWGIIETLPQLCLFIQLKILWGKKLRLDIRYVNKKAFIILTKGYLLMWNEGENRIKILSSWNIKIEACDSNQCIHFSTFVIVRMATNIQNTEYTYMKIIKKLSSESQVKSSQEKNQKKERLDFAYTNFIFPPTHHHKLFKHF